MHTPGTELSLARPGFSSNILTLCQMDRADVTSFAQDSHPLQSCSKQPFSPARVEHTSWANKAFISCFSTPELRLGLSIYASTAWTEQQLPPSYQYSRVLFPLLTPIPISHGTEKPKPIQTLYLTLLWLTSGSAVATDSF